MSQLEKKLREAEVLCDSGEWSRLVRVLHVPILLLDSTHFTTRQYLNLLLTKALCDSGEWSRLVRILHVPNLLLDST